MRVSLKSLIMLMARSLIPVCVMVNCASSSVPAAQGPVRVVYIHHRLIPEDLHAFIGEEIRWINGRKTPVRLEIEGPYGLGQPCQSDSSKAGFQNGLVLIPSGHYAEFCFARGGVIQYRVWLEPKNPRSPNFTGRIYLDATV
jgi:hypothetical protein